MYSVTQRARRFKQPHGGFLPIHKFHPTHLDDGKHLFPSESIHASLIGLCVDYLTRFLSGTPAKEAFFIPLAGAYELDLANKDSDRPSFQNAQDLLLQIKGLDGDSVFHACKLVGYDVCYRAGVRYYQPVNGIIPDKATIHNITVMVQRSLSFLQQYGPIVKEGFTFEGGYTKIVSSGDGDLITEDTLWDFKVLKSKPSSRDTLQLLMYYLMGQHSIHPEFRNIQQIGFFNPRSNTVYLLNVSDISNEVMAAVENDVIGYEAPRGNKRVHGARSEKAPSSIDRAHPKKVYPVGTEIHHPTFGSGVVEEIRPMGALHLTRVKFHDDSRLLCTSVLNRILHDD